MPLCLVARAPYSTDGVVEIAQWGKLGNEGDERVEMKPVTAPCSLVRRRLRLQPVFLPEGTPLVISSMRAFGGGILRVRSGDIDGQARTAIGDHGLLHPDAWPSTEGSSTPGALGAARVVTGLRADSAAALTIPANARRARLWWGTSEYVAKFERDGLWGATWVDAELLPHQVAVARHVLSSPSVSHVLADEVGLGKSVEALMIWSALSTQDPSLRTIVCAPRALIPQWCFEVRARAQHRPLARRFADLPRVFVDRAPTTASALDDDDLRRLIVMDPETLRSLKDLYPCDLLIVDEVHLLNDEQRAAVERIARGAQHTLLLTATPSDTRRNYGAVATRAAPLSWALRVVDPKSPTASGDGWDDWLNHARELAGIADDALAGRASPERFWGEACRLAEARGLELPTPDKESISAAFRRLTPFERLIRTRRGALPVELLPQRLLSTHPIDYRTEELTLLKRIGGRGHRGPLSRRASSSWRAVAKEAALLDVDGRRLLRELGSVDSRVEALIDLLASIWRVDRARKVIIRADYAPTRDHLVTLLAGLLARGALRESSQDELDAWRAVGPLGAVSIVEKSQATLLDLLASAGGRGLESSMLHHVAAFEDSSTAGTPLLIAGDEAAVGLNLQGVATDLVFFELPWRPLVVEQWIGRLDRLGRRPDRTVRLHVFRHAASPDAKLLMAYERLGLFSRSFRSAEDDERIAQAIDLAVEAGDWSPVLELVADVASIDAGEETSDSVLDLPLPEALTSGGEVLAGERFLEALRASGFAVERRESSKVSDISWPTPPRRIQDAVALREVRSALRPKSSGTPHLAVDARRRWRRGAVDFLSPRHVLVRELQDDFAQDACIAAGSFRCQPSSTLPLGSYLLVLGRTYPAAGAQLALWATGVLEVLGTAQEDRALVHEYSTLASGLERAFMSAEPPQVSRGLWRVSTTTRDLGERLDAAQMEVAVDAITGADPSPSPAPLEDWIVLAEAALSLEAKTLKEEEDELHSDVARALCNAAAYAGCRARGILARRQREVAATSASIPQFRAARKHALELAEEVFRRLGDLPSHGEDARCEALRVRGVAAYSLLVAP